MKRIGIPGWSTGELSFGASKTYLDFIKRFGEPVILMPSDKIDETLDGILLPGGEDINPNSYGAVPSLYTGNTNVFKQYFFDKNLPQYIEAGIPVMGICLGAQQLAAYFGGVLEQNLIWHAQSKNRWEEAHPVKVTPEGLQYVKIAKNKDIMDVNSHHHQALLMDKTPDCLEILALAKCEDKPSTAIVEAFRHKSLPIGAVQWHPEELYDGLAMGLFRRILHEGALNRKAAQAPSTPIDKAATV